MKMASFVILILAFSILGFSAWASVSKMGLPDPVTNQLTDGTNNSGPHGFSEILYAYSSCTGNNGSAFAGLTANAPWYDTTLGLATLFGRFAMIVPILALAGSLARKKLVAESAGTFPVSGSALHQPGRRHRAPRGRAHLCSGARAGTSRRTLPHARRQTVLNQHSINNPHLSTT